MSVAKTLTGLSPATTYHFRVVAESEAGVSYGDDSSFTTPAACKGGEGKCAWSTQTTPNPELRTEDTVGDVSCPTTTLCVAVGNNLYSGKGFNQVWNGSEWKLFNTSLSKMKGISCVSASWCMAVTEDGLSGQTLKWSGGKLTAFPSATSLPAGTESAGLSGISCSAETACTAVGDTRPGSGTENMVTLAERYE